MAYILSVLFFISCYSESKPPAFWSSNDLFGPKSVEIWNKLSTKGELDFDKLYKFLGSRPSQDGDLEFKASLMIYSCNTDPYEFLYHSLSGKDLNKKVFSLLLIGHLKDLRFKKILGHMSANNKPPINNFYGENLGELAAYILKKLDDKNDLRSEEYKKNAATWLIKVWSK
jgi:hypothetical protein